MMKKEEIVIFPLWVERGGGEVKPLGTLNLIYLKGGKASRLTKL